MPQLLKGVKIRLEEFVQTRHCRNIACGGQRRLARKHTLGHLQLRTSTIITQSTFERPSEARAELKRFTSKNKFDYTLIK